MRMSWGVARRRQADLVPGDVVLGAPLAIDCESAFDIGVAKFFNGPDAMHLVNAMPKIAVLLLVPIWLTGCVSVSSSDPNPPQRTTVVTPAPGTTTVCNPGPC